MYFIDVDMDMELCRESIPANILGFQKTLIVYWIFFFSISMSFYACEKFLDNRCNSKPKSYYVFLKNFKYSLIFKFSF